MILDCFTFFNELDLLEGRLEYLYDTVDYFVIVESNYTFSGLPKPLNYLNNIKRYQKYTDKILYYPFYVDPTKYDFSQKPDKFDLNFPQWKVEISQRNHIGDALRLFPDDAIVLISDLDEIPSKHAINLGKEHMGNIDNAFALEQKWFYYNFDTIAPYYCKASVISTNKVVKENTPHHLRHCANEWNSLSVIHDGGWHLTYWGGAERISQKIKSFSHQEYNKDEFTDLSSINKRISSGSDPFDRGDLLKTDLSTIPSDILQIFSKYIKG